MRKGRSGCVCSVFREFVAQKISFAEWLSPQSSPVMFINRTIGLCLLKEALMVLKGANHPMCLVWVTTVVLKCLAQGTQSNRAYTCLRSWSVLERSAVTHSND